MHTCRGSIGACIRARGVRCGARGVRAVCARCARCVRAVHARCARAVCVRCGERRATTAPLTSSEASCSCCSSASGSRRSATGSTFTPATAVAADVSAAEGESGLSSHWPGPAAATAPPLLARRTSHVHGGRVLNAAAKCRATEPGAAFRRAPSPEASPGWSVPQSACDAASDAASRTPLHSCACAAADPIRARLSPTAPTKLGVSTQSAWLDASNSWCWARNVGRCGAGAPLPPAPPPADPCIATHSLRASIHEHSPRHSVAPDSEAPVTHAAHVAARWCPQSTHAPGSCGSDSNKCSLASNSSSKAALRLKECEYPWRLRPCLVLVSPRCLRPPR
jgi:hypothetical protein